MNPAQQAAAIPVLRVAPDGMHRHSELLAKSLDLRAPVLTQVPQDCSESKLLFLALFLLNWRYGNDWNSPFEASGLHLLLTGLGFAGAHVVLSRVRDLVLRRRARRVSNFYEAGLADGLRSGRLSWRVNS